MYRWIWRNFKKENYHQRNPSDENRLIKEHSRVSDSVGTEYKIKKIKNTSFATQDPPLNVIFPNNICTCSVIVSSQLFHGKKMVKRRTEHEGYFRTAYLRVWCVAQIIKKNNFRLIFSYKIDYWGKKRKYNYFNNGKKLFLLSWNKMCLEIKRNGFFLNNFLVSNYWNTNVPKKWHFAFDHIINTRQRSPWNTTTFSYYLISLLAYV